MKSAVVNMPTNILKECDFKFSVLADCIKKSFETSTFPGCLNKANVTAIFKKDDLLKRMIF